MKVLIGLIAVAAGLLSNVDFWLLCLTGYVAAGMGFSFSRKGLNRLAYQIITPILFALIAAGIEGNFTLESTLGVGAFLFCVFVGSRAKNAGMPWWKASLAGVPFIGLYLVIRLFFLRSSARTLSLLPPDVLNELKDNGLDHQINRSIAMLYSMSIARTEAEKELDFELSSSISAQMEGIRAMQMGFLLHEMQQIKSGD